MGTPTATEERTAEARAVVEQELRRIARRMAPVPALRKRREELILELVALGVGVREVGRIAGVTHQAVTTLLERRGVVVGERAG